MNKTIRKRLRTDDEFDMLMDYTRHNIKQAGQKILSGSMEAAPYKKVNTAPVPTVLLMPSAALTRNWLNLNIERLLQVMMSR